MTWFALKPRTLPRVFFLVESIERAFVFKLKAGARMVLEEHGVLVPAGHTAEIVEAPKDAKNVVETEPVKLAPPRPRRRG